MEANDIQKPTQPGKPSRKLWDIPKEMALILLAGNLIMFLVGLALFKQLRFESPALLEFAAILLIDAVILVARWKLPKTWSAISGEKL